jgi:hypothetical protein
MPLADQLKARWDIAPPKGEQDFYMTLAKEDATCRITASENGILRVDFGDESRLYSLPDGTFKLKLGDPS